VKVSAAPLVASVIGDTPPFSELCEIGGHDGTLKGAGAKEKDSVPVVTLGESVAFGEDPPRVFVGNKIREEFIGVAGDGDLQPFRTGPAEEGEGIMGVASLFMVIRLKRPLLPKPAHGAIFAKNDRLGFV